MGYVYRVSCFGVWNGVGLARGTVGGDVHSSESDRVFVVTLSPKKRTPMILDDAGYGVRPCLLP